MHGKAVTLDGNLSRHVLGATTKPNLTNFFYRTDGRKRFSDKRVAGLNAAIKKPVRVQVQDIADDETIPKRDW